MTKNTPLSDPRALLLTWGGSGCLRPASGTWGTLAALPFVVPIHIYIGPIGLIFAALLLYIISIPCIRWFERQTGTHDSSRIVVDEVIGIMVALTLAAPHLIDYVAAFFLFRMFDAIKPGPVGWIDEKIEGAHGVLLDDVIAGALTALCLLILHGVIAL